MIILSNLQFGLKEQTIFVFNESADSIRTVAKVDMENVPETLCSFYYSTDAELIQLKGPKEFCEKIAERTKEKALELYEGRKPIKFIFVTGE